MTSQLHVSVGMQSVYMCTQMKIPFNWNLIAVKLDSIYGRKTSEFNEFWSFGAKKESV
jgi:hypothetical protein